MTFTRCACKPMVKVVRSYSQLASPVCLHTDGPTCFSHNICFILKWLLLDYSEWGSVCDTKSWRAASETGTGNGHHYARQSGNDETSCQALQVRHLTFIIGELSGWVESRSLYKNYLRYGGGVYGKFHLPMGGLRKIMWHPHNVILSLMYENG